jgi:hypothetical protein
VLEACSRPPVRRTGERTQVETDMRNERSGWVTFAGVLLLIDGTLNVIYGISAIGNAKVFNNNADYIAGNLKTWGWITLLIGILQVLAAGSLWRGGLFGRLMGIFAAGMGAIAALLAIPAYPFLSLAAFAMAVVILHQIIVHGTEGRRVDAPGSSERAYEGMAEYKQ